MNVHTKDIHRAINNVEPIQVAYGPIKKLIILLNNVSDNTYWEDDFKEFVHELSKYDYMDLTVDYTVEEFNNHIPRIYHKETWEETIDMLEHMSCTISENQMERAHDAAMIQNVEDYENQYSDWWG